MEDEIKIEKPKKKVEPVIESGKVAFIREGVTILRDVSESNALKSAGWVRK